MTRRFEVNIGSEDEPTEVTPIAPPPLRFRLQAHWLNIKHWFRRRWWAFRGIEYGPPGISVTEIFSPPRPRLVTDRVAILGPAEKGPVSEVKPINSFEEFARFFGWAEGPSGPRPVNDDGTIDHPKSDYQLHLEGLLNEVITTESTVFTPLSIEELVEAVEDADRAIRTQAGMLGPREVTEEDEERYERFLSRPITDFDPEAS